MELPRINQIMQLQVFTIGTHGGDEAALTAAGGKRRCRCAASDARVPFASDAHLLKASAVPITRSESLPQMIYLASEQSMDASDE